MLHKILLLMKENYCVRVNVKGILESSTNRVIPAKFILRKLLTTISGDHFIVEKRGSCNPFDFREKSFFKFSLRFVDIFKIIGITKY